MKKQAAVDHFGGVSELAAALRLTPAAVSQWGEYPPPLRQLQIERIALELKAEPDCMEAVLGFVPEKWDGKTNRRTTIRRAEDRKQARGG